MKIQDELSSTNSEGTEVFGHELADAGPRASRGAVTVQIVRTPNAGSYSVKLEGGIPFRDGTVHWGEIGSFTQTSDTDPTVFTISLGAKYRLRHVSGVAVTALMTN